MSENICGECCHLEKSEHFSLQCKHCNGAVSTSNTACNHFSKQYGICPECGSYLFSYEHTEDNDWQLCTCERCGCLGTPEEFLYNSVFARITSSLEVLAEKLVYLKGQKLLNKSKDYDGWIVHELSTQDIWKSTITHESYKTKPEAVAATLAKLNEVTDVAES